MLHSNTIIALFDFDGTLTEKDTLFEIAKYSTTPLDYSIRLIFLLPIIVLSILKVISRQKGKEIFLQAFFKSKSELEFNAICQKFVKEKLPDLLRKKGIHEITNHLKNGNKVVIVSASPENWIRPWADPQKIEVIATRLKFRNDQLIGIEGINCNGEEKVRRIRETFNLNEYEEVIAYGDTKGDLPMLTLAHKKFFKPFH